MTTVRPALLAASILVVVILVAATADFLSRPVREPTGLQLILSPHPDDEMLAWPTLEDDPSTYTVVVAMTRGEATNKCTMALASTQLQAGELLPDPLPEAAETAACGRARVKAWSTFLSRASEHTDEIRVGASERTVSADARWGGEADFRVGDNASHVVLSLSDGGLTPGSVTAAVEALLERRGRTLPNLPVRRIVSAAYWNDSTAHGKRTLASGDCVVAQDCPGSPTAFEYEHPDHRRTSLAMPDLAPLTEDGAWVNVPPGSTATLRRAVGIDTGSAQTLKLSRQDYDRLMGLGEHGPQGPERLGLHQQIYGWLAFPGDWWSAGDGVDAQTLFARKQTYLVIPGDGR